MTTIAKALKEKNKLKNEISQLQKRLLDHNCVIKGNNRPFDLNKADEELVNKSILLAELKMSITKANLPVQHKIYLLAELRGLISFYKKLPAHEGIRVEGYRENAQEYVAFFNEASLAVKIIELEDQADVIQDELESFNHQTNI